MPGPSHRPFPAGSTAVRRDVFRGRVWSAMPTRVVAHDPTGRLVLAHWPGVEMLAPETWIASLRDGGSTVREATIPSLAAGDWRLGRWTWRDTSWLHIMTPGQWFSVSAVLDDARGGLTAWYVNFERPHVRRGRAVDTFDLLLDLVVSPDRSCRWKDEEEYAHARRLGVIDDRDAAAVARAREEALALVEAGAAPFDEAWPRWRRDPAWPLPTLPASCAAGTPMAAGDL